MKKTFIAAAIILAAFAVLLSINEINSAENETGYTQTNSSSDPDEFIVGAYSIGCDTDSNRLQQLGLNMWHRFLDQETINGTGYNQTVFPKGFTMNDGLFKAIGEYQGDVTNYYNNVSQLNNNYIYLTRPKIEMLTFAQRSDYHPIPLNLRQPSPTGEKWWYGYHIHNTGEQTEDNGKQVMRCIKNTHRLGYIAKDLRPSWEQVKEGIPNNFFKDAQYSWFVKPSVRIDPNVQGTTPIFEVKIYKKDGNELKSVIVTRDNFDYGGSYQAGQYKDEFFPPTNNPLKIDNGADLYGTPSNPNNSEVDFAIYWYGNCDMWLERVRVENDWANQLFSDLFIQSGTDWIQWEVQNIANDPLIKDKAYKFLVDESEYNMYPAIGYLNEKISGFAGANSKLSVIALNNIVYWIPEQRNFWNGNVWTDTMQIPDIQNTFQSSGMNEVFTDVYPLYANVINGINYGRPSYVPGTLIYSDYSVNAGRLGYPADPQIYEDNFNANIDEIGHHYIDFSQKANYLSRIFNKPYISAVQIHSWYNGSENVYSLREPTNQEIEAMTGISLTYGAKGIIFHAYNSMDKTTIDGNQYSRGLVGNFTDLVTSDCEGDKRLINAYGQHKWDTIVNLTAKLKILGRDIVNFDNTKSRGYRLHIESERLDLYGNTFVNNILPLKYGNPNNQCNEDYIPSGMTYDCPEKSYLQVGTFTSKTNEPYFMLVNRRCSPIKENEYDGRRLIRIGIPANRPEFANYKNWNIVDVYSNATKVVFDKSQNSTVYLGWIMPGEIKLYKFVPVVKGGGTLVSNETISGNVNCNGKIYNNGYNITINEGAVITFSDTAGIEMNGGTFTCGVNADNVDAVTLQKSSGGTGWNGLVLNNCPNVGIYNTNFSGIKANDTAKAVLISNCGNVYFRRNNFTPSSNSGAIQTVYTNPSFDSLSFRVQECNFYMGQSGYSGISIISNASMTVPVVIEWCTFNTANDTSNAVLMNNITGGAIKNNTITNFSKSIIASSSVIDIYRNTIIGNNGSYGLRCLAGSDLKLKTVSGYYLGGENYIRNYGTSSSCIYSDNSMFDINNGENHFDLSDTVDSKFLTGTLGGVPSDNVDAAKNCFHLDSVNNIEANHTMTWYGTSDPVSFTFIAYNCELTQPQDFMVFNYGGYNDTVYYNPGGEGSGFNPDKTVNMQEGNYRSLRDTINLNLRKRNYAVVEDKAKQLLMQYPDSLESIGMVQKLYVASLTLDQNGNKIGQLKTYLENLISSNQQNAGLTKRAFYHIQKCKVKLGQYQSALDGFQYIMTQNPYSYEGLVASWDYAATYLLMGQGGSLSGDTEEMTEELNTPADTLLNRMSRNDSKTKTGSDGQKTKIFYEKVKIATKDDRTIQEEKIKQLEKTIETSKSDVTKTNARTELAAMKTIKESVKIRKPNSVKTHIAIVNSDIKKIFGIGKSTASNTQNNLITASFELHQNYPNPFNPSTKIAFDLPKDAKVKLVIYDILGREIKTLIHNEFRTAGKYITEFNGSNLASGVYFYRLQANDYVSVKKMALIK